MGTSLAYLLTLFVLVFAIPVVTFPLWKALADPETRGDPRRAGVVAPYRVTAFLFSASRFLWHFLDAKTSTITLPGFDPRLCKSAAEYAAADVPRILRYGAILFIADLAFSMTHVFNSKYSVQLRLYFLAAFILGTIISLTPHLRIIYLVLSTGRSAGGRTLNSSSPSSASDNQPYFRPTAKSRLLNSTPGPNIVGMSELQTNAENSALKNELDRQTPNTGLDALLGMGLKHGASGKIGAIDKFYGTGRKLGSAEKNKSGFLSSNDKLD
ncbi:hypothetical protein HK100_005400 [Physocladia obscura]|uniref:Uncharacterized protein n=1 Tax=Physocladia obscura TaxID=109957 RepID=A0AAD5ST63_9FUNG|nr:hypothetical protein HK100_005400 [Physocladia obscura]